MRRLDAAPEGPLQRADLARGAIDAHRRQGSPWRTVVPALLLLAADLAIGWLNYHAADDVQPVAAALIVAGFGFAAWRPRWAWLIVPALWIAVPASSIVGYATNYHPGMVKAAPLYETAIALIPTILGALAGAATRRVTRAG